MGDRVNSEQKDKGIMASIGATMSSRQLRPERKRVSQRPKAESEAG